MLEKREIRFEPPLAEVRPAFDGNDKFVTFEAGRELIVHIFRGKVHSQVAHEFKNSHGFQPGNFVGAGYINDLPMDDAKTRVELSFGGRSGKSYLHWDSDSCKALSRGPFYGFGYDRPSDFERQKTILQDIAEQLNAHFSK